MTFPVQPGLLDRSTGSSIREDSAFAVVNDSAFFLEFKIFSGFLVPRTSTGADRELHLFILSFDRKAVTYLSQRMMKRANSRSRDQYVATVP